MKGPCLEITGGSDLFLAALPHVILTQARFLLKLTEQLTYIRTVLDKQNTTAKMMGKLQGQPEMLGRPSTAENNLTNLGLSFSLVSSLQANNSQPGIIQLFIHANMFFILDGFWNFAGINYTLACVLCIEPLTTFPELHTG